jgi:hypothetical protein
MGSMPALLRLLMFASFPFTSQVVTFPSGGLTLHGIVFRPEGKAHSPLSSITTVATRIRPRRSNFSARYSHRAARYCLHPIDGGRD